MSRIRKHSPPPSPRRRRWIPVVSAFGVFLALVLLVRESRADRHPTPRAGVTSEHVLHQRQLPAYATPGAAPAYAIAARVPQLLDGLHCYCACDVSIGHHSLLSCFEDDHGAACEVCQIEATIAAGVQDRGGTLDDARRAVDERFRT